VLTVEHARFVREQISLQSISVASRLAHRDIYAVPGDHLTGRENLRLNRRSLGSFDNTDDWKREPHQCEVHELLAKAAVAPIYGKTFNAEYQNILEENGWEGPLKAETAVGMPRRFGKTTAIAMFAAAMAMIMSGPADKPFIIAIFSPGQRQSSTLLRMIKAFCALIADQLGLPPPNAFKNTREHYWLRHENGSVCHVNSFPCSIQISSRAAVAG